MLIQNMFFGGICSMKYSSVSNNSAARRVNLNGNGNFIDVGVRRRLFRLVAMSAAFFTFIIASIISVNVSAEGDPQYYITYNVNSGGVTANSFSTGSEYNSLPCTNGTTVTSLQPTADHAAFYKWKVAGSGSSTYSNPKKV